MGRGFDLREDIAALHARVSKLEALLAPQPTEAPPWMHRILIAVQQEFSIEPAWVMGFGRAKLVSTARQVAMYVAREHTMMSYPQIGRALGRDHSTVVHGRDGCAARMLADPRFARRVERVAAHFRVLSASPAGPCTGLASAQAGHGKSEPQEALHHG